MKIENKKVNNASNQNTFLIEKENITYQDNPKL